jgi:hypothetical protein
VSLVEVTSVKLEAANGAALGGNPGPGGGLRIFAEASQPGSTDITDKVKVTATIFPPITDAPPESPVRVYFRSFDVDERGSPRRPAAPPRSLPTAGWLRVVGRESLRQRCW